VVHREINKILFYAMKEPSKERREKERKKQKGRKCNKFTVSWLKTKCELEYDENLIPGHFTVCVYHVISLRLYNQGKVYYNETGYDFFPEFTVLNRPFI
jgi:hypothetical protein